MNIKTTFIPGISVLCTFFAGCELSAPIQVGSRCPGVEQVNVLHISSDECMKDDTCSITDAEPLRMGYCPPGFECIEMSGTLQCKHGCESDKVMCDGECIDPLFNMTHCGAKIGGTCSDSLSHSANYQGVNCKTIESDTRMVCTSGKCQPNNCGPDEHPVRDENGVTSCEHDSKDACGSVDVKCGKTEVCKAGVCTESCQSGQIACDGTCIDPMTSVDFCGAKAGCTDYRKCTDGSVCSNGECRILDCASSNEMKCTVEEGEQCIDIASDPLNCGNCNYDCDLYKPANAETVGCSEKRCIYQCNEGYTNCGADNIMECVDLTGTKLHCGTCNNVCVGKQFCKNSSCAENDCNDYECPQADQCKKNDAEACGIECTNCKTRYNAAEATCDDVGVCHVISCATGYHLAGTEGSYSCEPNDTNACGSPHLVDATDCQRIDNVNVASCDSSTGKCRVHSCSSGYHVVDNILCEADDDNNCGVHGNACHVDNGTSKCQSGTCQTTACDRGFHELSNLCVSDTASECGGKNCETAVTGWLAGTCNSGVCTVTTCQAGFHLNGNSCEKNDTTNCLAHGNSCSDSNATGVKCDNTEGCMVTGCKSGYHIFENKCEKEDDNNCGSHGRKCMVSNGTSQCQSGSCKTTACSSGYHIDTSLCIVDDTENCGSKGKKCSSVITGWTGGTCTNGTCNATSCAPHYHLFETTCEENTPSNCKKHGTVCNASNAISNICDDTSGCLVYDCKPGYHSSSDHTSCNANTDTACGSDNYSCMNLNSYYGWLKGKCDTNTSECVVDTCQKEYYKIDGACIPNCFEATHFGGNYCCPTYSNASNCSDYNYSNCNQCESVRFFSNSTYDISYHEACLDSVFGTSRKYSNVYCYRYACDNWKNALKMNYINATNLKELVEDDNGDSVQESCYYKY